MLVQTLPLPRTDDATVVVPAPGAGPGNWSGAPSAVLVDGTFYLTYRVRRPLTEGRGVSTVVASSPDGVRFTTVCEVFRDSFGAESFERPVVVPRPEGGWRLYLSCATPGSKHWWIEALDADTVEQLPHGQRRVVLDFPDVAVKDPVILPGSGDGFRDWQMWVCVHPLDVAGAEDRMTTAYATSTDGLTWQWQGTVLAPTPGTWDARGARVTAVLEDSPESTTVLYDGRATAEDNWFEVTGVAIGGRSGLRALEEEPVARSPHSDGALRYATAVPLPDGRTRFYFEAARPDGAHDLLTSVSG
ncbi:MAG: hypothetical protein QM655_13800 [Nocardioidaceae bacterium]